MFTSRLKWISQGLRNVAPYLLVELLLPGGTLLAVLLWLSQHGHIARVHDAAPAARRSLPAKVLAYSPLR